MKRLTPLFLCLILACPSEDPVADAGEASDAGHSSADTGDSPADAGLGPAGDAGSVPDGAAPLPADAGAVAVDAGPRADAGPVEGVEMRGTVRDFQSSSGVAGIRVCVHERPEYPCATSDQDGAYSLTVPQSSLVMVFTGGENAIVPQLMPLVVNEDPFVWNQITVSQQASGLMFQLWGQTEDPSMGQVAITTFIGQRESDGLQGAVVALEPASGAGPLYTANGFPSAGAESTDSNGLGAFLNVPHGQEYRGSATKAGWTCVIPSEREPETFPVLPGHLTSVTRRCTED